MKQTDQNIIKSLKLLKNLTPDNTFRNQMERKVRKLSYSGQYTMPLFALRVAAVVFAVLLSSTGMVQVASTSKPGETLYPVKQIVDTVTTSFTADKYISKAPSINTQPLNEITPTPSIKPPKPSSAPPLESEKQTLPANDFYQPVTEPTQTPTPTPTLTPTPTPTPKPLGGVQDVPNSVNPVVQTVPVNVHIDSSLQPTPTPQPNHEGSKDNGSNAGAGGSLLPKINIGL